MERDTAALDPRDPIDLAVATADTVATERTRTLQCAAAKAVGSFSNPSRPRDRFFLAGTGLH